MDEILEVDDLEERISFKWGDFDGTDEGPLDVLLMLIKKSKVEIEDVELGKITEQFLQYISEMGEIDMNISSAFLDEATRLLEIKSKKLLPKLTVETDEEEDPEYLYKLRLKEYKLFKESAENLKNIESNDKFYKEPEDDAKKFRFVLKDMQLDMLLDAFTKIMIRTQKVEENKKEKVIQKEIYTVEQKVSQIKDFLIIRDKINFDELFSVDATKDEVVTTFMALLELLKLQVIAVSQGDLFDSIQIQKKE